MNRDQTANAIKVMALWLQSESNAVQWKRRGEDHWRNPTAPSLVAWNWELNEYRIKPVPVEVTAWAVVHGLLTRNWSFHETLPLAMARLRELQSSCKDATDSFVVELKGTYTCDT